MADDELARLRAELEAVRGQVAEKGTSVTRKANALGLDDASRGEGSVEGDTGSSVGDSAADRLGIALEELLALSSRAAGGAGDKLQADKRETPLWMLSRRSHGLSIGIVVRILDSSTLALALSLRDTPGAASCIKVNFVGGDSI